jgi:hypothetical protein
MMKLQSMARCEHHNGQKYFQNVSALPGHERTDELALQSRRSGYHL